MRARRNVFLVQWQQIMRSLWCTSTLLKVGKAKKETGSGIHVNNLKKTFHVKSENYSRLITAVSDLNLRVDTGQLVVLLGPNGAGKSTLMSILTTELIPSSGTAMVGGCDITKNRQTLREGAILVYAHSLMHCTKNSL